MASVKIPTEWLGHAGYQHQLSTLLASIGITIKFEGAITVFSVGEKTMLQEAEKEPEDGL